MVSHVANPGKRQGRAKSGPEIRAKSAPDNVARAVNPLWAGVALGTVGAGFSRRESLPVSQPGDQQETEAERIADWITRSPAPQVQRSCAACAGSSAPCPECEEEQTVHRSAANGASAPAAAGAVLGGLGTGAPLDTATRHWFEPRFGADLGSVRVHTDAAADRAAEGLAANAFAIGDHIAFAGGRYEPQTARGRHLLAHELVHVLQGGSAVQRSAVTATDPSDGPTPYIERPAVVSGGPPPAGRTKTPSPETCPPPTDMLCPPANTSPGAVTNTLIFAQNQDGLSAVQKTEIDAAAAAFHAAGGGVLVRVDGYASAEGECEYNWNLSCRRAQAVEAELASPSDGTPSVPVAEVFAHGESDEAGRALAPNRKATISIPAAPPLPTPPPTSCGLPVLLGTGRTACASGTDFTHFDFPAISFASEAKLGAWAATLNSMHLPLRSLVTTPQCMAEMDAVLVGLAGLAGHAAFARFVGGAGGTESHAPGSTLGAMVLASGSFAGTVATVQLIVESQLAGQAASGALDPCALSVVPPATHFGFGDGVALKTVIGGTQGEKVFLTGFSGSIPTRSYTMDLRFVICDDFGVDESDLYFWGLFPFWVLQHERSATLFKPFVNEFDLSVTVTGTF